MFQTYFLFENMSFFVKSVSLMTLFSVLYLHVGIIQLQSVLMYKKTNLYRVKSIVKVLLTATFLVLKTFVQNLLTNME